MRLVPNSSVIIAVFLFACLFISYIITSSVLPVSIGDMFTNVTYRTYGLNFSPYIDDDEDPNKIGNQITDEELHERMEIVAPYTKWIRTFGCNDDLNEAGIFAHEMGLKVAVGAWLDEEPEAEEENRKQIECLKGQAKAGHVDIAIVGSEVLLRGDLSEDKLIDYINEVKQYFQEEGINVPVTYADVHGVLLSHPNVISAVDLVFVNYYPYWEGRKIDYAIAYIHRWHKQVMNLAGGKEVIVSETGWPSCGKTIGEAVPSLENASFYFLNFVSWARANNVKYFYFEALDEAWKANYEGPQGACWGIWDRDGNLKPGMQDVFNDKIIPDNWSNPIPEAPIIDFFALPIITETNVRDFVVASSTEPENKVWLNGAMLPPDAMDEEGNFAVIIPLLEGDNLIELTIESEEGVIANAIKTVHFDRDFSTDGKRLIYVDSVALGEKGAPDIPGTIVIDLDNDTLLGIIKDKHVTGISPDGRKIYTTDRTIISTDKHQELGILPFASDIISNSFIVSPNGIYLYSGSQKLDLISNALTELPINIITGSSWAGAPIPGGPTISADGQYIYCGNSVKIIDVDKNIYVDTSIMGHFMSDIALTPDNSRVLVSEYSYSSGELKVYDAKTYEQLATIPGLGDFAGEIAFSKDGQKAIVGSAGNPAWGGGGVSVIDLKRLEKVSQTLVPLADNLTTSGNDEFFVASGESGLFSRLGIDVYVLEPSGNLVRTKTFFLGINGFKGSTGKPKNDQIRKIVFKPETYVGIDMIPPNTIIVSGPSGQINYNNATFSFTGSDNVTPTSQLVYSYFLEGYDINWSSYTSQTTKSYSGLQNGSYIFHVKAKDQAGNIDQTPASRSFQVKVDKHIIIATAGANGDILPSGEIQVNHGSDQTFEIAPKAGYHVADVLVDDKSVGAVTTYTFENVTKDHKIHATFAIDINTKAGWNLVSITVEPYDNNLEKVLESIDGCYQSVWSYDNGWKEYIVGAPSGFNDLETIEPGKGYWIKILSDCILKPIGKPIADTAVSLKAGWNLVGYKGKDAKPIEEALSSIDNKFISMWSYNNGWSRYIKNALENNLEIIEPGKGYWINVTDNCVWDINTTSPAPYKDSKAHYPVNIFYNRPEIPYLIYGDLYIDGVKAKSDFKPAPTVVLKTDGKIVSSYRLGAERRYGDFYVLEVPPVDNIKINEIHVQFADESFVSPLVNIPLGLPGQLIRFDLSVYRIPKVSKLGQNYPNPFNPDTWIPYQLSEDSTVKIKIFTSTGQLIRTLELGYKPAGFYTTQERSAYWDGKNETGEYVASGVYFYTIQAGNFSATRKMVIVR